MIKQTPILWAVVITLGALTHIGENRVPPTPKVVIDGYTVNSTLNSPATLPLGTTLILVCRLSGIPHGQQTTYTWTRPNTPCQQTGYTGKKINNNTIAINTTSTSDGGTYTCTVTAGGTEASQNFSLSVNSGKVVHSYGRLIFHERVITDRHQLQPPNNDTGDGRIECTVSRGEARFSYRRYNVQIADSQKATAVIPAGDFGKIQNWEGYCSDVKHYHYLFLSDGKATLPPVTITVTRRTANSIKVNIGTIPNRIARVIIGYHRLDLGQPVVGKYMNNNRRSSITFSSLVPGAKYRITAWGLGGSSDSKRSRSPAVVQATTSQQNPSPPRDLTITRVFQDGIELNWIPPRETNGGIKHYIIKYSPQGAAEKEISTTDNTNYYNLTGLERGQTYNITVVAVNSPGRGRVRGAKLSHIHNPRINATIPVSSSDSTSHADHTKGTTDISSLLQTVPSTATEISTITTQLESTRTNILMLTSAVDATIGSAAMTTTTKPKEDTTGSVTQSTGSATPSTGVSMDDKTSHTDTIDMGPFIGGAAGGVILLLVGVLVLIICTIGLVRRRGKRSRATHHEHSHYYSTVQEGEQHVYLQNTPDVVQMTSYNTGGQYEEVEVKGLSTLAGVSEYEEPYTEKMLPQPFPVPLEYQFVDDDGDMVMTVDGGDVVMTVNDAEKTPDVNPEDFYAKPSKKHNNKKKDDKLNDDGNITNPRELYAEVDKSKKRRKFTNHANSAGQENVQPTTSNFRGYEPSADTNDTPHEQNGEANTTQPTPSANVEGLYAEVDKTQKKKDREEE